MNFREPHYVFAVLLCVVLTGCSTVNRQSGMQNMYELHPVPSDNDMYYRQPNTYSGCAVINDAPSCGGG